MNMTLKNGKSYSNSQYMKMSENNIADIQNTGISEGNERKFESTHTQEQVDTQISLNLAPISQQVPNVTNLIENFIQNPPSIVILTIRSRTQSSRAGTLSDNPIHLVCQFFATMMKSANIELW